MILHDENVRDTRCVLVNHFGCIVSVNWNLRQSNIDWQAERIFFNHAWGESWTTVQAYTH